MPQYPHFFLRDTAKTSKFTRPRKKIDTVFCLPPIKDRVGHAEALKSQLQEISRESTALKTLRKRMQIAGRDGIYISFLSGQGFDMKFERLDLRNSGIELLAVINIDGRWYATVFVPHGKITIFIKKIEKYATEDTGEGDKKKPKNRDLVEGIASIRKATLESLWTDERSLLPPEGTEVWWEVWLRKGSGEDDPVGIFRSHAHQLGIQIGSRELRFPERSILLARATRAQLAESIDLLNVIAELRKPKVTADFYTSLDRARQRELIDDIRARVQPAADDNLAVCMLDTGVTREHPLIVDHLAQGDMHTIEPAWQVHDLNSHGTGIAGICLYGDIVDVIDSGNPIPIPHRLESVKVFPPPGFRSNDPPLYGWITLEAVSRAETTAPQRRRVITMAVTTNDFRDNGKPSSWSSAIDILTCGYDGQPARLAIISAGNSNPAARATYPNSIQTELIQDPGQAWNALCIGAYTEKTTITEEDFNEWQPIAPAGDLSPATSTSLTWEKQWPNKPDVVFEGGNNALPPQAANVDWPDSLQLLTTHYRPMERLLTTTGDTSAATYLAARFAALVWHRYPQLWPESVRGLIVHSANWTDAMKLRQAHLVGKKQKRILLKTCGYGVPDISEALYSTQSAATMCIQDVLAPYIRKPGSSTVQTREMRLHTLPWPKERLLQLGGIEITLRVTLSYFIEPSPGERGKNKRYQYASHGLRFDVKTASEKLPEFLKRINEAAREDDEKPTSASDSGKWNIGPLQRNHGSIHSDLWTGTAADLAEKGYIAVYPVSGWWKERPHLNRWDQTVRYTLILSLKTPAERVDLYTPIANKIAVPVEIIIPTDNTI
jgi:hypothetical protein